MQVSRLVQPWSAAREHRLSNLPTFQRLLHSSSTGKLMERPELTVQVIDPALAAAPRWQPTLSTSTAHLPRPRGKGNTVKADWLVDSLLAQWKVGRLESSDDEVPVKASSDLPLAWDDRANGMLHWCVSVVSCRYASTSAGLDAHHRPAPPTRRYAGCTPRRHILNSVSVPTESAISFTGSTARFKHLSKYFGTLAFSRPRRPPSSRSRSNTPVSSAVLGARTLSRRPLASSVL